MSANMALCYVATDRGRGTEVVSLRNMHENALRRYKRHLAREARVARLLARVR